ncbi:MAG: hypothetical protein V4663_00995 [Bacteroidota bacterium]
MKAIPVALGLMLFTANCFSQSKGKSYQIAYNVHIPDKVRGNYEIFTMEMDGTNKKNITNNPDVAWTYYAYKKKLYFVSDRDTTYRAYFLYESDSDGKSIKKVSNLQLEDSWMSSRNNGTEMVVTGRIGKGIRSQLFIVNTKTGTYKQLTNDTAAKYGDPCFSPDGKQIAYSYQKNKRDRATHEELFIMNADGTGAKQLTQFPEITHQQKNMDIRPVQQNGILPKILLPMFHYKMAGIIFLR